MFSTIGILLFCFSCSSPVKLKKLQENYIPSTLSGLYIGMPMKDVKEARGMGNLSVTKKGELTILKEEYSKDSITLIQYNFNKKKKLSMIIIEYSDDYEIYDIFKAKFGEPNSNKAWLITLNDKFKLLIWTQQHSLIIADNKQFKN
ncbi:MAG: hypothetical protein V1904_10795 [Bacteroidota bacterium]